MRIANIRNGLAYKHDEVSYFQSNHGHRKSTGYFKIDAMPYKAIIALLKGESITIIDATQHNKPLTDAMKFGLPTWCLVFNRAIRRPDVKVCDWETKDMRQVAYGQYHRKYLGRIRRLAELFGVSKPAIIGDNVVIECHRNISFDDKPEIMRELI